MELYEEILLYELKRRMNFDIDAVSFISNTCYLTLQKIKAIIENDSLDDPECFQRIEQIVCTLEEIGSDGGNRHDFS